MSGDTAASVATQRGRARHVALMAVLDEYGVELNAATSAAEDLAPFVDGQEPIGRYAAITAAITGGGTVTYVYPSHDTAPDAIEHAMRNVTDDIFAEMPRAVVDLDTGTTWAPKWDALPWAVMPS